MAKEIDPKGTARAYAFDMWMKAPNPMVTFFKTLDVTNLIKVSKRKNLKLNMLIDYCIGKAAAGIKEFYILPVDNKLMQYDNIAVNTIVKKYGIDVFEFSETHLTIKIPYNVKALEITQENTQEIGKDQRITQ